MKKAIPYYRVSTERQGQSGLGLEVQQQSVISFAAANHYVLHGEFVEVESGKKNNRPILLEALAACKNQNATLLIAKLDRLGRNVAFISKLMESGVEFKAVDNPFAGKLIVHIMAAFAEHERDIISERTSAALQAAKKNGVQLGTNGKYILSKRNKKRADDFAEKMKPILQKINNRGIKTIRAITDELNKLKMPTYRNDGSNWHINTVYQLIERIKRQQRQATPPKHPQQHSN
jgi:DNA invertase Pin-like site-specific DNA recombinase